MGKSKPSGIKGTALALLVLTAFSGFSTARGQIVLNPFIETGKTNVSKGQYINSSFVGSYTFNKTTLEVGAQYGVISSTPRNFSGLLLSVSQELQIKEFPFSASALWLHNPYSDILRESSLGLALNHNARHFSWLAGIHFRTYTITNDGADEFEITSDRKLRENRNLIYRIGYNLKPLNYHWNVGLELTNIDHFLINQETNPMLNIYGSYNIKPDTKLFLESWHKSAGSLNISANYFGYFIRTGITWTLNL